MHHDPLIVRAVNDQKALVLALQAFACALVRALPEQVREQAETHWKREVNDVKCALLHSETPEDFVDAFDFYVEMFGLMGLFPQAR